MPLEPIVKGYRALQVTFNFGKLYLDPADETELRNALAPYLILQSIVGYSHPYVDMKIVELSKQQLYDITTLRFSTPFEEVLAKATSSVEKIMTFVHNYTYNVRLNYKEMYEFSAKVARLMKEREEAKNEAREKLKKFRENIIGTPRDEYEKTFKEGASLIMHSLFGNEYPARIMELTLTIIHHKWGHVSEKDLTTINEEKERFLLDVVAPLMMGEK